MCMCYPINAQRRALTRMLFASHASWKVHAIPNICCVFMVAYILSVMLKLKL